jgi:hypothetical protein
MRGSLGHCWPRRSRNGENSRPETGDSNALPTEQNRSDRRSQSQIDFRAEIGCFFRAACEKSVRLRNSNRPVVSAWHSGPRVSRALAPRSLDSESQKTVDQSGKSLVYRGFGLRKVRGEGLRGLRGVERSHEHRPSSALPTSGLGCALSCAEFCSRHLRHTSDASSHFKIISRTYSVPSTVLY